MALATSKPFQAPLVDRLSVRLVVDSYHDIFMPKATHPHVQIEHVARSKLALLGFTEVEIAEQFGISPDTIQEWKAKHREFSVALASGKAEADAEVAASLYQRATGAKVPAVKIFLGPLGKDGESPQPIYVPYTQCHPPETSAAKLWLTNRQPERWRERKEIEHLGSLEHRIAQMTPEERVARLMELRAKAGLTIEGEASEVEEGRTPLRRVPGSSPRRNSGPAEKYINRRG